ncbi:PREDICTED: RNA-binding protein lark isoform X2 [Nicrophorus vespilloides]|uniref:RNA-binding protein lark isoform X2 n=1 Tax=Nicrophorus vespilloides TaxID=110193 RepID=A0ABM1M0V0_NICVS|nr:PREDICTED: RNA-binding protein lark isoform X2 [Nicrophorus vespilloides]
MSRRSEHTTKVFVGSLPPNVTPEDLKQLFAPYGAIAECDIANRCGFLHLEDKDLAEKAITELNNTTFMGGRISVEKGRVKPRGSDRRMRTGRGGPMGPRKRDMGPYSREGNFPPRGPRNGSYGREFNAYDDFHGDYGRFDDGYDRRPPMYDDRRGGGYMDRRPFNGYDRRPYSDDRGQYDEPPRAAYDDRRMPPAGPNSFDERRPPVVDRRPLIDEQAMGQGTARPPMPGYDRSVTTSDMFSRRDSAPKPISNNYDRQSQTSYGTTYGVTAPNGGYGVAIPDGVYGTPAAGNYGQQAVGGYADTRGQTTAASYMDNRGQSQQQAGTMAAGFGTVQGSSYSTTPVGGYGDNYGVRPPTNTYDTAYPPLPQQRGFAGGNAQGPHRDMPPVRRY